MIPFSKYVSVSEKENHSYLPILTLRSNYLEELRENGALEIWKKKRYHFQKYFFRSIFQEIRQNFKKTSAQKLPTAASTFSNSSFYWIKSTRKKLW